MKILEKITGSSINLIFGGIIIVLIFLLLVTRTSKETFTNNADFGITNISADGKSFCLKNGIYNKLGNFKLDDLTNVEASNTGLIYVSDRNDWKKMTESSRNETWAHAILTSKDKNGIDVKSIINSVAQTKNIPDRIPSSGTVFFNYFIKHVSKNSGIILMKCGYINN